MPVIRAVERVFRANWLHVNARPSNPQARSGTTLAFNRGDSAWRWIPYREALKTMPVDEQSQRPHRQPADTISDSYANPIMDSSTYGRVYLHSAPWSRVSTAWRAAKPLRDGGLLLGQSASPLAGRGRSTSDARELRGAGSVQLNARANHRPVARPQEKS